ncbi:MAG: UbiA family prenyltransferase [Corynebacteriales bacterium]|nr:UbiA family prenyltransferase [Mycobacteriales bacterium]
MRSLLQACHPLPTLAVTTLTTIFTVVSGRSILGCALVAAAALTGQLSVGWSNDAIDHARDRSAGRSDKPLALNSALNPQTVWAAATAAALLCVPLSFASGFTAGLVHICGVSAGWAYNLGLKATVFSWVPYAIGFASLPCFVMLGLPDAQWPPWWITTASALLGCGAHLANVLPDIDDDLAAGVRGLGQRLGHRRVLALIPVPLLAATALLTLAGDGTYWAQISFGCAVLVSLGGVAFAGRFRRLPFLAAIIVASLNVVLLTRAM